MPRSSKHRERRGRARKGPSGSDRGFALRFLGVIVGLHVVLGTLVLIARTTEHHTKDQEIALEQLSAIDERTKPVGEVATDLAALEMASAPAAPAAPAEPKSGDEIVQQVCSACHQSGMLGAPRIGDAGAWKAREKAAGGIDGLVKSASQGKGSMPPKGGQPSLTDKDLRRAIEAMLTSA